MNTNICLRKNQLTISILSIIIAICTAVYYWCFRYGFDDNSFYDIIKVLALSFTLNLAPAFINTKRKTKAFEQKWHQTSAWDLVSVFFALSGLGAISLYFQISLLPLVLFSGAFLFIWAIYSFTKERIKQKYLYVIIFTLFGIFVPFFVYKTLLHDPLFLEKIITGSAHVDTIYLSQLSNLIKTYNIPTIGIDGIEFHAYHWGSNWIFSYLSSLTNISSLKFYNLAYPVVFFPLLINSFLSFLIEIQRKEKINMILTPFAIALLFIAIIGIYPEIEKNKSPLMTHIVVLSESFLLSTTFIFLITGIFIAYQRTQHKSKILLLFIIPFLILFSTTLKVSAPFLLLCGYGYYILRYKQYKNWLYICSFIISFIFFLFVQKYNQYIPENESLKFELFSFLKNNVSSLLSFIFSYYIYLIIFLILYLLQNKVVSIKTKQTFVVEILIFIAIAGFLPGTLIDTHGRNALYFMDLQRWVSIVLIMAYLPLLKSGLKNIKKRPILQKMFLAILSIAVGIMILINVPRNYFLHVKQAFIHNIYIRNELIQKAGVNTKLLSLTNLHTDFERKLHLSQKAKENLIETQLLNELKALGKLPRNEKQKSCIYIPKTNKTYWNILTHKTNGTPFIASCLSGIVMVEGIPDPLPRGFGYGSFINNKNANKIFRDEEIKQNAKEKGFAQVFVIKEENSKIVIYKILTTD